MTVIEASSAGFKDMADSSVRITFEFEPRHAAQAVALFGPRGRSVAIAALKDGHGAASDAVAEPDKPKGGELARLAGIWCNEPEFVVWLNSRGLNGYDPAQCIREMCGVSSRADLDHNPVAAEKFQRIFRARYMAWFKERQA